MRGFQYIGVRNWLLLATLIISSSFILIFWPNQGLEWISFVLCSYIIGTGNLLTLIVNFRKYNNLIIGFLLFRCFWSFSFTIYMLLIEFSPFPSLGLSIILLFYALVFLDVLIIIFNHQIVQELGSGFIPKINLNTTIK
ncbi:MAG: hypothetical protein HeimC3_45310 [Candidatus Heimdallarchaeota archaeon LC_3]|nr:MAG: hypothetical protein HeimC3_45310 [Candidatus Heimdallarchaeota archaeon LC_3]